MAQDVETLLGRVAVGIGKGDPTPSGRSGKSILTQAAASFARRPSGAESTIPTGFDPQAASLFEAVVEAAFLVANSDGEFDETERQTFETVVHEACQNTVQRGEVRALVSDLLDQLTEDGVDQRIRMVSGSISNGDHKHEVMRIAALMAHISGGVLDSEREVLNKLATGFGLSQDAVTSALDAAQSVLNS